MLPRRLYPAASVHRSALDELHFFDEDTHESFRVAEVGDVGKSRLTFRTSKACLHGLHAIEVEFAEPVVRRLVSFEVLQGMILDVPHEPGISFRIGAWVFFQ